MLGTVLILACVLAGQAEAPADDELKLEVRRLVLQLNAPELARRERAEQELLAMGPKILELLPSTTDRTAPEVKLRLGRIRQQLQQTAAEAVARAALVTFQGQGVPLSKVLAALQEQTGNRIIDYRRRFGHELTDPKLDVDFDKTPFWQALDEVLDQAELTVYGYGEERGINFIHRDDAQLARCGRAAYSGPFRFEPLVILAQRDLRNPQGDGLKLKMEIAWEPRLKPISLKQKMAELKATDEKGNALAVDDRQAELEAPAGESATAVNLVLPLKLPPRGVMEIAQLRGRLTAMIPGKIETFTFDELADAKNVEKRIAGVTVVLQQVRKNNELWEVRLGVRFDQAGDALASFRGWVFNNEAHLVGPDGKPLEYETLETTRQTPNEVGVAYLFFVEGPLADYKFVYKTPGVIVATAFDYELKNLKLP